MKILIIYAIVAIIYLLITLIIQYIKLGKNQSQTIVSMVLAGKNGIKFKKYFLTWYGIPLMVIPAVIITCQFMFPVCVFVQIRTYFKKRALANRESIFKKSKAKKLAEAELKDAQFFNNAEEMLPPVINS